jgi:hypothetical protein
LTLRKQSAYNYLNERKTSVRSTKVGNLVLRDTALV